MRTLRRWELPDMPWGASLRAAGRSSTQIRTNRSLGSSPVMMGFMLLVLSPSQSHPPLLLRLSGERSSCVFSLMYRYICIVFGYLSVIVSSTGLILSRPAAELAWICTLSPSEWELALPYFLSHLLIFTSTPHPIRSVRCLMSRQALSWARRLSHRPRVFLALRLLLKAGHNTAVSLLLNRLAQRHSNGSKLFISYLFNGNVI